MLLCYVTIDFNYNRQQNAIIKTKNLYEKKMLFPIQHQSECQLKLYILISYFLCYVTNSWNQLMHLKWMRPGSSE
jgi:hypothetical protein